MVNRNFLKIMYADLTSTSANRYSDNFVDIDGTTRNTRGMAQNGVLTVTNTTFADLSTNSNAAGLFVGTGDSSPTIDDVNLDNRIDDSDLELISMTLTRTLDGQMLFSRSLKYVGASAKTIKEVGLFKAMMGSSEIGPFPTLVAREVIEPITVNNDDTFTVSMVIG